MSDGARRHQRDAARFFCPRGFHRNTLLRYARSPAHSWWHLLREVRLPCPRSRAGCHAGPAPLRGRLPSIRLARRNGLLGGGDKRAENTHRLSMCRLRERPLPYNPTNSGHFASLQEKRWNNPIGPAGKSPSRTHAKPNDGSQIQGSSSTRFARPAASRQSGSCPSVS
jgi:hypothetical protein